MAEKMLSHNMRNVLEPIKKDISNYIYFLDYR